MTASDEPYTGRDSRRSNSPIGHARTELIYVTDVTHGEDDAGFLQLSGSPVEYFVHQDYQNMDHYVTGTYKFGIAGIYDHTASAWLDPDTYVHSVSKDGYTIHLTGAHGLAVGDLAEVYYYARNEGPEDWRSAAQTGDPLMPETFDACLQKINDCPPLDFENYRDGPMFFNSELAFNTTANPVGLVTVLDYTGAVGTWAPADLPFYITGIFLGWKGDTFTWNSGGGGIAIDAYADTTKVVSITALAAQSVIKPLNSTGSALEQGCWLTLGLLECESDFSVDITPHATFTPTTLYTVVMGWHL